MKLLIHPRVVARHPQLSAADVIYAWEHRFYEGLRPDSENFPEYLWLGCDASGRELEMVGTYAKEGLLIYHANTPPSRRTILEVERSERRFRR